jgi:hypothetical protein
MKLAEATMEEITVRAVITRADGSVEDCGTIAHWQRDEPETPLSKRWIGVLKNFFSPPDMKDD